MKVIHKKNYSIIKLEPVTVYDGHIDFKNEVKKLILENKDVVLDFSQINYINSAFIGALATLDIFAKSKNRNMYICNISPIIEKTFKITQLDKIFNFISSVKAAIKKLESTSSNSHT